MVYLAFYKYKRPCKTWQDTLFRVFDEVTRFFTHGKYSHCELAIPCGNNEFVCYTSSNRDDGVRIKQMPLPADKWDLVEISEYNLRHIFELYYRTQGLKYDLCGAIGVVTRFGNVHDRYFCSEWCAEALELPNPHKFSPNSLYRYLTRGN